jgi:hypothetical protein
MRASPRTILLAGLVALTPVAPAVVRAAAPPAPPAASEAALLAGLTRALEARAHALTSVTSDAVIEVASPAWRGGGTCQGRLAARRPGALRLVGYAAVATVFDVATDGARFQAVVPPSGTTWVGRAEDESLLVGLPILPGDVVAALFGEPYGKAVGPRRVVSRGAHPWIAWTLASGDEVRTRFDAARWLPQRAELWRNGKSEASLDYHDYRRQGGTWWPSRIQFTWPKEHGRLALTFDRPRFNGALADSLFAPRPPAGLALVDLSSDAGGAESQP